MESESKYTHTQINNTERVVWNENARWVGRESCRPPERAGPILFACVSESSERVSVARRSAVPLNTPVPLRHQLNTHRTFRFSLSRTFYIRSRRHRSFSLFVSVGVKKSLGRKEKRRRKSPGNKRRRDSCSGGSECNTRCAAL